ncbi:MAG: hypothetical protein HRT99_01955 [Mycoplasmatales bacterium]|nr:hypothetical protein [Mycoplasmatales bacterium]
MKIEKIIKKLNKTINVNEIFSSYNELKDDVNTIILENMSIDFMVQNNSSHNEFLDGIRSIRVDLISRKKLWLGDFSIIFKNISGILYPQLSSDDKKNMIISKFFNNKEKDDWFREELLRKIKMGINVILIPGLMISLQGDEIKIFFNEQFYKRGM